MSNQISASEIEKCRIAFKQPRTPAYGDMMAYAKMLESKLSDAENALIEILGGIKLNKKISGAAQINLSVLDMQKIASDALTEINRETD